MKLGASVLLSVSFPLRLEKKAMKSLPRGVITTMFTDMVDSTRIKGIIKGETSARRDANFRHQIKDPHDSIVLTCVRQSGGYVVNPTGDGFCIAFVDAEEAVLCALRIQHHLAEQPIATPLGPLQIRIGLHTGVVNPSGDDYIASTVDKAARIQSLAGDGQVFVSQQTQVLVFDRTHGIRFEAQGIFDLKGLQAEQLYQVIPLPELELPPVTAEDIQGGTRKSSLGIPSLNASDKTNLLKSRGVWGLFALFVVAAIGWGLLRPHSADEPPIERATATPSVAETNPATPLATQIPSAVTAATPILPAGSQWDGNFHFLPPMQSYDGSVAIHVTRRQGDTFAGTYSSEDDKYRWLIEGKVNGNRVHWDFIKVIKKTGPEDAVGKAYGEATIVGDRLEGFYRNRDETDEVAKLDLRASK